MNTERDNVNEVSHSVRDAFLTEQMGECWHDLYQHCRHCNPYCRKCNQEIYDGNNDFSTWEGFGKLWEWVQKQEWWNDFVLDNRGEVHPTSINHYQILSYFIHPDRFADAIFNYLKDSKSHS